MYLTVIALLLVTQFHLVIAATNPWNAFNRAPTSRTLVPISVFNTSGTVKNASALLSGSATRLTGNGSSITVDFGKEVGGIVTVTFSGTGAENQSVGLAFSESSLFVGTGSDASNGGTVPDGAIFGTMGGAGNYAMPVAKLRGGFRYLTLFLNSTGWVDITDVSLNFTASPSMNDPSAYANYFYCDDALLNRIWYAGAYTVQLCTIGSEVLSDGPKRDRTVWPGDLGISSATAYVSTGDVLATKNSLTTLYQIQRPTGKLPYAGPEVNDFGSDTYHIWTLIGTYNYYLYSADKKWLDGIWENYTLGVTFITDKIDAVSGLLIVDGTNGWAGCCRGGENIEANALLYRVLTTGVVLAQAEGNLTLAKASTVQATALKKQINSALLWDATVGAFKDNPNSTTLYRQDGNSLAVWYGVPDSSTKVASILHVLKRNWNAFGSQTPEYAGGISPFIGSIEVLARLTANDDENALELIRTEWGHMLNDPRGTNSTMWEAMQSNGDFRQFGSLPESYVSLAHGWSTGPTSALTNYVLGIAPDTAGAQDYHVIPHPGNLRHVEGSLMVGTNKTISTAYDINSCGNFSMTVDSSSNNGSTGVIAVPLSGHRRAVQINDKEAWNGTTFVGASGIKSANQDSTYVYFKGVQPGKYTLSYNSENCTT